MSAKAVAKTDAVAPRPRDHDAATMSDRVPAPSTACRKLPLTLALRSKGRGVPTVMRSSARIGAALRVPPASPLIAAAYDARSLYAPKACSELALIVRVRTRLSKPT